MKASAEWPEGVPKDLSYQHRSWKLQRLGRILIALMILGAVCGLFGPGLFSKVTAGAAGAPLRAEYIRFLRMQSPTALRLHLGPEVANGGEVHVWVDRAYLDAMSVEQITPRPERVEADGDRILYTFAVKEPYRGGFVAFDLKPRNPGWLRGRAGAVEGSAVKFSQVVYP